MTKITYEMLKAKIVSGTVTMEQVKRALEIERESAQPVVTMPTLGAMSASLNNSEATAAQKLEARRQQSAENVAVLERILREADETTETKTAPRCVKCGARGEMTSAIGLVCADHYDEVD